MSILLLLAGIVDWPHVRRTILGLDVPAGPSRRRARLTAAGWCIALLAAGIGHAP